MDKYESKLRIEEMEKLKARRQYKEALRLADTIEWTRIRNSVTLYKAADLYRICRNYTKCRDILELAYERNPYAKNVVFALCDVCLEFGDLESATEYYKEYAALSPDDVGILVLKYKMLKALEAGIDERIEILEKIKNRSHIEEWEFELATLYHRAGLAEKCVEQCDDIFTWFGEGAFVYKALELKMLHEPLSEEQQAVYNRRIEKKAERESRKEGRRETGKIMRMSDRSEKKERSEKGPGEKRKSRPDGRRDSGRMPAVQPEKEPQTEEYHVNTINMNPFNTIDLQAELASNIKGYIGGEPSMVVRRTPDAGGDTKVVSAKAPGIKESVTEEDFLASYAKELGIEEPESTLSTGDIEVPEEKSKTEVFHNTIPADSKEVFFEDVTGDIDFSAMSAPKTSEDNSKLQEFKKEYAKKMEGRELPESLGRLSGEDDAADFSGTVPIAGGVMEEKTLEDGTVELIKHFDEDVEPEVVKVGRDKRTERRPERPAPAKVSTRPRQEEIVDPDYVDMLPVPEEKQISGQLNISDILAGWEEMKREKEREFRENFRKKTLENTGNLLADFEREANSGLLATLENPALINSVTDQSTSDDFIKGISVEDMKKGKKVSYPSAPETEEDLKIGKVIEAETEEALAEAEPDMDIEYSLGNGLIPDDDAETEVPENAGEPAKSEEPESMYYGNVTAAISGNIWDEVDNYQPEVKTEEKTEEELNDEPITGEIPDIDRNNKPEEGNPDTPETKEENTEAESGEQTEQSSADETNTEAAAEEEITVTPAEEKTEEPDREDDLTKAVDAADILSAGAVIGAGAAVKAVSSEEEKEEEDTASEVRVRKPQTEQRPEQRKKGKKKKHPNKPAQQAAKEPEQNTSKPAKTQKDANADKESQDKTIRSLTEEEKRYFGDFAYDGFMKRQIVDAIENITLAAFAGNLIITSENEETAAKLAHTFYKYIKHTDPNFTGKSVRTNAETLNKKDLNETFNNVANGALIVSHAGRMTNSTINAILSNLNQDSRGVVVILYDTKPEIRKLLERAAVLERFFNCRVDIANMSLERIAEKGKDYAKSKGYTIDDLAMLAFSGRLSELMIGTHIVTLNETFEIVDDAIEHCEKGGLRKLVGKMTKKRFDPEGYIILQEKDFEYRRKSE